MGSIYQPTYRDRHGQPKKSRVWRIAYTDENGQRLNVSGFRDKKASLEKLRQLELRTDRIRAGLPVEGQGAEPSRLIEDALAAWQAELRMGGRTPGYIKQVAIHVRKVSAGCRWKLLGDMKPDAFGAFLAKLSADGAADWTVNHARDKCSFFCNFCVRHGWLAANPLAKAKRANAKRRPRRRRAFTADELARLLAVAGPFREMILFAALTGLRRRELRLLQRRDVVWEPSPRLHLRAEATKSRRAEKLPLLPEAAEVVKDIPNGNPTDRLFPRRCEPRCFVGLCEKAGIPKRDADGRQVDFHALRLTFCTMLATRTPIQFVQRMMRHATIGITVGTYLDLGIGDMVAEVERLPRLLDPRSNGVSDVPEPAAQPVAGKRGSAA